MNLKKNNILKYPGAPRRAVWESLAYTTQIVADYVDLDLHTCRCLCRMQPGPTRRISMKLGVDQCTLPHYVVCDIACTLHGSGMTADVC